MDQPKQKSFDLLGVRPLTEAANTLVKATVEGASAFLSRICLPAAEEFGLLLRDKVSAWRTNNAARIAQKAEYKYNEFPSLKERHAHPRLIVQIIEQGSWIEADNVQELWAGLLASSCTEDGQDDSNLMFIDLLARLTLSEARILDHICRNATKVVTNAGWIAADCFIMRLSELQEVGKISDFHRLDRELDHLRTVGLIGGGFPLDSTEAIMTPTPLALQMYARCQGFIGDPLVFFGIHVPEKNKQPLP